MRSSSPWAVSAVSTRTRSKATSSSSAATRASALTIPCPSSTLPVNTVIVCSASMRTHVSSCGMGGERRGQLAHRARSRAARRTALMIRQCEPQRHRCGSSAARISVVARIRVALEERDRADDHARDAVAALGGLLLEEGPGDRVQLALRREPLERHDARPANASTAVAQLGRASPSTRTAQA